MKSQPKPVSLHEEPPSAESLLGQYQPAIRETKLEDLDKLVENSSEKNRNFFIAYLGLLIYVQAIIFSTTDLQLLASIDGLKLPIVDLTVPLVGFYVIVPIFVIALHFNFLQNLESHHYKLMRWQAAHPSQTVPRARIQPFIFDFAELETDSQFALFVRWANTLLCLNLAPITLGLLLWRYTDRQEAWATGWHLLAFSFDLFLVWKLRVALKHNRPPVTPCRSWRRVFVPFRFVIWWAFVLFIVVEAGFACFVSESSSEQFLAWGLPVAQKLDAWGEKIASLLLPRIAIDPSETVWKPDDKALEIEAKMAGEADWVNYFNEHGTGFRPSTKHLRFAKLPAQKLPNAKFEQALLEASDLSHTKLQGAFLEDAQLQEANLLEAQMQGANMRKAQLQKTNLNLAQLQRAKLNYAQLQGTDLVGALLQEADLVGTLLQEADLGGAQLQGVDLTHAQLQGAFLGKHPYGGSETRLQGASLGDAQFQGAYLGDAQLQGADLTGAQFQGADLSNAQLQGAKLKFARLQGALLVNAQLQGADLGGVQLLRSFLNILVAELGGAIVAKTHLGHTSVPRASGVFEFNPAFDHSAVNWKDIKLFANAIPEKSKSTSLWGPSFGEETNPRKNFLGRIKEAQSRPSKEAESALHHDPAVVYQQVLPSLCHDKQKTHQTRLAAVSGIRSNYHAFENQKDNPELQTTLTEIDRLLCLPIPGVCADLKSDIYGLDCNPFADRPK